MSEFIVTVPFVGFAVVHVEADTAAEAMDEAIGEVDLQRVDDPDGHWEYELVTAVTRGNVCYAPVNDISVEDEDGNDVTPPRTGW